MDCELLVRLTNMRLISCLVVSVLIVILGGCAGVSNKIELTQSHMKLLTGEAIFGEPVQVSESTALDPLHINDEMRIFVGDIASAKPETARYRKLITKLERNGYYDESYDPTLTSSASETFASKKGNCLSYTNMFVALARIANLDAQYQLVHMRFPSWDVQGRLLIRNNHINVFVEGPSCRDRGYADYEASGCTQDFNLIDPDPEAPTTVISDEHATSLFYANLSVKERIEGNDRVAFSYLRRAIELVPSNPDLWINLGAMYGRFDRHEEALASYQTAQQFDPKERAMLSGMERSLRAMGRVTEADFYERRIRRYRLSNPYYLFAMAEIAYQEGAFKESLESLDQALRMEKRNARFHFLKGLNLYRLEQKEEAKEHFLRAQRLGRFDDLWLKYVGGLDSSGLTG